MQTLDIIDTADLKQKVGDVVIYGDPDTWMLLCKASSKAQGWMKSTKYMNLPQGCVIQVTTQQTNPDGSYALAEALTFIPDCNL